MKKTLLITFLLFIMLIFPALTQAWYTEGHYDARECAICGKTIYVWQGPVYGFSMPSMTTSNGRYCCHGEEATPFYKLYKYVCGDCQLKYYKDFDKYVETFFINRRPENIKLIEKYQEERKQKGIEDRKNKIIELEKELEGLRK